MACLLKNEPASYSVSLRLRVLGPGAGAKASLNRALSSSEDGWDGVDPKPRELPMARVKVR